REALALDLRVRGDRVGDLLLDLRLDLGGLRLAAEGLARRRQLVLPRRAPRGARVRDGPRDLRELVVVGLLKAAVDAEDEVRGGLRETVVVEAVSFVEERGRLRAKARERVLHPRQKAVRVA